SEAHLGGANWAGANLRGATFRGALLEGTNLSGADLTHADLTHAVLHRADLTGARLTDAALGRTIFAAVPSLPLALGLEATSHSADSSLDLATLAGAACRLPAAFLEGIGLAEAVLRRLAD
ncbi:MAG: pentapeptide repeat-containing protein, partial [Gemmatimonadales bacterium]|nr:pentapeptide repeat-containing protein [Gemmatimonadales bacterium]